MRRVAVAVAACVLGICLVLVALLISTGESGPGGPDPTPGGLVVGGVPISAQMIAAEIAEHRPKQQRLTPGQERAMRDDAVLRLVLGAMFERELADKGIRIPQERIDLVYRRIASPDLTMPDERVRQRARQIAVQATLIDMVNAERFRPAPEARVRAHYQRNPQLYRIERSRAVLAIGTGSRERAIAAMRELRPEPGVRFSRAFKRHSEPGSVGHDAGGALTVYALTLGAANAERIFAAAPGAVLGPLRAQGRWYVVLVGRPTTPAGKLPYREAAPQIRGEIDGEVKRGVWLDYVSEVFERRRAEIRDPEGVLPQHISIEPNTAHFPLPAA